MFSRPPLFHPSLRAVYKTSCNNLSVGMPFVVVLDLYVTKDNILSGYFLNDPQISIFLVKIS